MKILLVEDDKKICSHDNCQCYRSLLYQAVYFGRNEYS